MVTDKHLKLRASPNSALAMTLAYIQDEPTNNQVLAGATLQGRFLPFAIDKDDPSFQVIAIRCANECEAWARSIREYAGLGAAPSFESMNMAQVDPQNGYSDYIDNEDDEDDEYEAESVVDPEEEERKRRRREDNMGV